MPGPEVQVNARAPFQPAPDDDADRGDLVLGLDDGIARRAGLADRSGISRSGP